MGADSSPGRVLGLDLGDVRVGVAISDTQRRVAVPRGIIIRTTDRQLFSEIDEYVREEEVTLVIVGLPLSLNGARGRAASTALSVMAALRAHLRVPVLAEDERFTTVEAVRRFAERDGSSRPRRRPRSSAPHRVDDAAAALFLQAFLDRSARP